MRKKYKSKEEDATTMRKLCNNSLFRSAPIAAAALAGFLIFAGAPSVRADEDCQRRVAKADHKLHEAIEHHGYESKQAERWRHELRAAREHCWNENHRWWDEDGHRWRSDRDWDDHDHDHK